MSSAPLSGLLVVSIEQAVAAPIASCRLADAGARVIKIERAEGDFGRGYDGAVHGESSYFVWANRGKESIVLDYKKPDDAALLDRLLAKADVFIQNLAPGALERAGYGSAALRERYPQLITCDITGYGDAEGARQLKAYDLLVQCESGLAGISGAPGAIGRIGVSICDIGAGMNATIAILSALAQRTRTGRGSGVAVSLFDGAADWMAVPYLHERYGAGAPGPAGLKHPSIAPYGAFTCRDGKTVVISIQNDREWAAFAERVLENASLTDDARFATNKQRVAHRDEVDALISDRFGRSTLVEMRGVLDASGTAYGQVRSVAELIEHPALRTWPMPVRETDVEMIAPAVRAEWDRGAFAAAPRLGEHTQAVRREFLG